MRVYRIQDADGRGPFKPGLSDAWADADGEDLPSIIEEWGLSWQRDIPRGWHAGCAVPTLAMVGRWFSPSECSRLDQLGYRPVALLGCRVIRSSEHQLLIIRKAPLRRAVIAVPWPHYEPATLSPWQASA